MRHHLLIALAVSVVTGLTIPGCGSDASNQQAGKSSNTEVDQARMRPVPWEVFSPPNSDRVKIVSSVGYCENLESEPRYGRIQVLGRSDGTYITTFMARSRPRPKKGDACLGVGYSLFRTITIDRDASGPKLYDASTDPPTFRGRLP